MTHRQCLCWYYWLEQQYNVPSRADYYSMEIAREIRMGNVKHPNKVKLEEFRLTLSSSTNVRKKKGYTEEDIKAVRDKALKQWVGLMTAPITVVNEDGSIRETITPPSVKRQNILKNRQQTRQQKQENNNDDRTGGVSSKIDSRRIGLPKGTRRGKKQD